MIPFIQPRNPDQGIETKLSASVWELNDKCTDHAIKWNFIDRARSFNPDTRNSDNKIKTTLSAHVWELKDNGRDPNIKWDFIEGTPSFNPDTRNPDRIKTS